MTHERKSPAGGKANSQIKNSVSSTRTLYPEFISAENTAVAHDGSEGPSISPRPSDLGAKKAEMNPIKRYHAKPGRKAAIIAQCACCMGCTSSEQRNGHTDHLEPGFRTLIRECSAPACPMFRFRPYQGCNVKKTA